MLPLDEFFETARRYLVNLPEKGMADAEACCQPGDGHDHLIVWFHVGQMCCCPL